MVSTYNQNFGQQSSLLNPNQGFSSQNISNAPQGPLTANNTNTAQASASQINTNMAMISGGVQGGQQANSSRGGTTTSGVNSRIQTFMSSIKSHSKVGAGKQIFRKNARAVDQPFLITLKRVQNLSLQDTTMAGVPGQTSNNAQARYTLEYHCTLFSKQRPQGLFGFYGRTCIVEDVPMVASTTVNGEYSVEQDAHLFLHSTFCEPTSELLVELVVCKKEGRQKEKSSAGFAVIPLFQQDQKPETVPVVSGSPRMYASMEMANNQTNRTGKTLLAFSAENYNKCRELKKLVPEDCLVGAQELIPGFSTPKFPVPAPGQPIQAADRPQPLANSTPIYLHNVDLIATPEFEIQFENFLKKLYMAESGETDISNVPQIIVQSRSLNVQLNNTWRDLQQEVIKMGEPNMDGVCSTSNMITFNQYVADPLMGLLFHVEFAATLPLRPAKQVFFTVGYELYLPQINQAGEIYPQDVSLACKIGSQVSPTDQLIWGDDEVSLNQTFALRVTGHLSNSSQAPPRQQTRTTAGQSQQRQMHHRGGNNGNFGGQNMNPMLNAGGDKINNTFQANNNLNSQVNLNNNNAAQFDQFGRQIQNNPSNVAGSGGPYAQQNANQMPQHMNSQQNQNNSNSNNFGLNNQGQQQSMMMNSSVQPNAGQWNQFPQQQPQSQLQQYDPRIPDDLKQRFDTLGNGLNQITNDLRRIEMSKQEAGARNDRTGMQDYEFQSQQQITMIGNVFYNLLNHVGMQNQDAKIMELSNQLKGMLQTKQFDNLMGPKVPHLKHGVMNLLKVIDIPQDQQIELIKLGYGDLLRQPEAQIRSQPESGKQQISIQKEMEDSLRANTITFKFVVLKTSPHAPQASLPRKVYFQTRFFSFPEIQTDTVSLFEPGMGSDLSLVRPGGSYYLRKETLAQTGQGHRIERQTHDTLNNPDLLSVTFEIDPSVSKIKNENVTLANYLKDRLLSIDIYDSESKFLFATAKVPLWELLRQQASSVVRAKEIEACAADSSEFRASIQVIMSNQGRQEKTKMEPIADEPQIQMRGQSRGSNQPSQLSGSSKYSKVVRSHPMDLTRVQQTNEPLNSLHMAKQENPQSMQMTGGKIVNPTFANLSNQPIMDTLNAQQRTVMTANPDLRKKLRVDRVRKMTLGTASSMVSIEDPNQPDWVKHKSLREIEVIRETKKKDMISQVLGGSASNTLNNEQDSKTPQLSVTPGQLSFLPPLTLTNDRNQIEQYSVQIFDPDQELLGSNSASEMSLVTDPSELTHWVSLGKCKRPPQYDSITKKGDILLKPGQSIDLLFKFLTTREVSLSSTVSASKMVIRPRRIKIVVLNNGHVTHATVDVSVVPSLAQIDHTFRFYEPEESHYQVALPPFMQLNQPGLQYALSDASCQVQVIPQTSIFTISGRAGAPLSVQPMTLFVFADQMRSELVATCRVEIHARPVIYSRAKQGTQASHTLSMPVQTPSTVSIFSNKPKNVFQGENQSNRLIRLLPSSINHISIQVRFDEVSQTQTPTLVNCVDVNTNQLIYSWLLITEVVP